MLLHRRGESERCIAKELKISKNAVHRTIERVHSTGRIKSKFRSGRPRITSKKQDEFIAIISKRDRKLTAPEIRSEVNQSRDNPISLTTVKRRLRDANLFGRVAIRKPLLRPINKKKRLQWARRHESWTIEDWKKVLWTDESKFEIFGSKRRVFVRRSNKEKMLEQCAIPTVKHDGGSVMVWGCVSMTSVGDLIRIDEKMNKEMYKRILEQHAIPSGYRLIGRGFILQQDNDPKHSYKLCREYVEHLQEEENLKNMIWPPQSPDLSPIELLWEELDRNVRQHCPSSKEHMWRLLNECWKNITQETIEKLIQRMPRIVQAVKKSKGGYFDEKAV
ncbi:Transposable element Tc1 transposase [Anthophora quadrimaculata]